MSISRRKFLSVGVVAVGSQVLPQSLWAAAEPPAPSRVSGFSDLATPVPVVSILDQSRGPDQGPTYPGELAGRNHWRRRSDRKTAQVRRRHGP